MRWSSQLFQDRKPHPEPSVQVDRGEWPGLMTVTIRGGPRCGAGDGRVAQRESTAFTRQGSLVQSQSRPPSINSLAKPSVRLRICPQAKAGCERGSIQILLNFTAH